MTLGDLYLLGGTHQQTILYIKVIVEASKGRTSPSPWVRMGFTKDLSCMLSPEGWALASQNRRQRTFQK